MPIDAGPLLRSLVVEEGTGLGSPAPAPDGIVLACLLLGLLLCLLLVRPRH